MCKISLSHQFGKLGCELSQKGSNFSQDNHLPPARSPIETTVNTTETTQPNAKKIMKTIFLVILKGEPTYSYTTHNTAEYLSYEYSLRNNCFFLLQNYLNRALVSGFSKRPGWSHKASTCKLQLQII